jgi:pimeloyl-ACP methyl ester carboxylesterase
VADRDNALARAIGKLLFNVAAVALAAYLGACAFLYFKQRDLIYFGPYTRVAADSTHFELQREGCTLRGWSDDRGQAAALIYFGGNAERVGDKLGTLRERFPDHAIFMLAYRGYGASDCQPSEVALVGDGVALFDMVARSARPVDVIGSSLGSGVAVQVASQRPVRRLVLITPFDSLAAVGQAHYPLLPVRWLAQDVFDSAAVARRVRAEVRILIAGRDEIIPRANSEALVAAFAAPPKVVEFPQATHNDIQAQPGFYEALVR